VLLGACPFLLGKTAAQLHNNQISDRMIRGFRAAVPLRRDDGRSPGLYSLWEKSKAPAPCWIDQVHPTASSGSSRHSKVNKTRCSVVS
jgi:hypothetical protein